MCICIYTYIYVYLYIQREKNKTYPLLFIVNVAIITKYSVCVKAEFFISCFCHTAEYIECYTDLNRM